MVQIDGRLVIRYDVNANDKEPVLSLIGTAQSQSQIDGIGLQSFEERLVLQRQAAALCVQPGRPNACHLRSVTETPCGTVCGWLTPFVNSKFIRAWYLPE